MEALFCLFAAALLGADPRKPVMDGMYWLGSAVRIALWYAFLNLLIYTYQPSYVGPFGGIFVWLVSTVASCRMAIASQVLRVQFDRARPVNYMRSMRSGFTALELLIVLAILVVLVALLAPAIASAQGSDSTFTGAVIRDFLLFVVLILIDVISLSRIDSPADSFTAIASTMGAIFTPVLWFLMWAGSWTVFQPAHYRDLLGDGKITQMTWADAIERPDEANVRAISHEQAQWLMKQALKGKMGSLYKPATPFHQRDVNGRAYWIAPLEYASPGGVWMQRALGSTIAPPPGYVRMSSENELEQPLLIEEAEGQKITLKFTPDSWFSGNLARKLYQQPGMNGYRPRSWVFELNDAGRPFYIVALCRPTVRFSGDRMELFAIIDPQTGEHTVYEKADLPKWVDNPMPTELIVSYTKWWGLFPKSLGDGMWSHILNTSGQETVEAASDRMRLTWGGDGKPYIFTGITSRRASDTSLVCHLLINPRTGEAFQVAATGQEESAVITAVNNMVSYQHLHGTDPVMYNLFGHRAWVVPVAGENHLPMGMAIVDPDISRPIYGKSKADALMQWRQHLADSTADTKIGATNVQSFATGTVLVREVVPLAGKSLVFLRLEELPNKVFVVDAVKGFDQAVVTMPGETVELWYLEFGDGRASVQKFSNESMPQIEGAQVEAPQAEAPLINK